MTGRWRWVGRVGVGLIGLGLTGMLASYPFVSGDPGPGPEPADPAWFDPVVAALLVAAGLGVLLVGASAMRLLILRRGKPG